MQVGNGFIISTHIQISVGPYIPETKIIHKDNNEIRLLLCLHRAGRGDKGEDQRSQGSATLN
jgi:hypothetical protein